MTIAHFTQTSPADTCKTLLTKMAATVCKHQLVSFFVPWLLPTAAKHELAFQSIKYSMVLSRSLAHCMHARCPLSQQQLETVVNRVSVEAKEMSE